jgi:hypothetical protein
VARTRVPNTSLTTVGPRHVDTVGSAEPDGPLEIAAAVNLREALDLVDGDQVEIVMGR